MSSIAVAEFEFEAHEDGELKIVPGDRIVVTAKDEASGWWTGYLENDPQQIQGLFPWNYVKEVDSQNEVQETETQENKGKKSKKQTKKEQKEKQKEEKEKQKEEKKKQKEKQKEKQLSRPDSMSSIPTVEEEIGDIQESFNLSNPGFVWEGLDNSQNLQISVTGVVEKGRFSKKPYYTIESSGTKCQFKWNEFEWLYNQYLRLYPNINIPPLMEYKIHPLHTGFETKEKMRMFSIQQFLQRIGSHPILRQAFFLQIFLKSTDEKRWAKDKKELEKKFRHFWRTVKCDHIPDMNLNQTLDQFRSHVYSFNQKIKNLNGVVTEITANRYLEMNSSLLKLSAAWREFGNTDFDWRKDVPSKAKETDEDLTSVFTAVGDAWEQIGKSFLTQSNFEVDHISIPLQEYDRIISNFTGPFKLRDRAQLDYHESQNSLIHLEKSRLDSEKERQKLDAARERTKKCKFATDTMINIGVAETEYFRVTRYHDFKKMMLEYVDSQISFYQDIVQSFQKIKPLIEKINITKGFDK